MTGSFENRLSSQEKALRMADARPFREILQERAMPLPLWAQREMTDSGEQLADAVKTAAAGSAADTFCIYAHVPYCRTRCLYCSFGAEIAKGD